MFNEEPLVALFAPLDFDEYEAAAQFLAVQVELEIASFQLLERVGRSRLWLAGVIFHHKRSAVPDHHGSRAVVALGNLSLEIAILQWVILGLHCQSLIRLALRRPLRHGPRL